MTTPDNNEFQPTGSGQGFFGRDENSLSHARPFHLTNDNACEMNWETLRDVMGWQQQHVNKLAISFKKLEGFSDVEWRREANQFFPELFRLFCVPSMIDRYDSFVVSTRFDFRNTDPRHRKTNSLRYCLLFRLCSQIIAFLHADEKRRGIHRSINEMLDDLPSKSGLKSDGLDPLIEMLKNTPGGECYVTCANWLRTLSPLNLQTTTNGGKNMESDEPASAQWSVLVERLVELSLKMQKVADPVLVDALHMICSEFDALVPLLPARVHELRSKFSGNLASVLDAVRTYGGNPQLRWIDSMAVSQIAARWQIAAANVDESTDGIERLTQELERAEMEGQRLVDQYKADMTNLASVRGERADLESQLEEKVTLAQRPALHRQLTEKCKEEDDLKGSLSNKEAEILSAISPFGEQFDFEVDYVALASGTAQRGCAPCESERADGELAVKEKLVVFGNDAPSHSDNGVAYEELRPEAAHEGDSVATSPPKDAATNVDAEIAETNSTDEDIVEGRSTEEVGSLPSSGRGVVGPNHDLAKAGEPSIASAKPSRNSDESYSDAATVIDRTEGRTEAHSPALITTLKQEISSFENFCAAYWIDGTGAVVPTPWADQQFQEKMLAAADVSLAEKLYGRAYVYSLACEKLALPAHVSAADYRDFASHFVSQSHLATAEDEARMNRLKDSYLSPEKKLGFKLTLFLQAVQTSPEFVVGQADWDRYVTFADFHDRGLQHVVLALLQGHASGESPLDDFRQQLGTSIPENRDVLERKLAEERARFRADVTELWSAAGGRIAHTHCRIAWKRFMEEAIKPLSEELAPNKAKQNDYRKWNLGALRTRERRLTKTYERIANSSGVGKQDRKVADKAALHLAARVRNILELADPLVTTAKSGKRPFALVPTDELHILVSEEPMGDPIEELCRALFTFLVRKTVKCLNPLQLLPADLIACPDLLRLVDTASVEWEIVGLEGISPTCLKDPLQAAALLLGAPTGTPLPMPETFLEAIRQTLVQLGRPELLSVLAGTRVLDSQEKTRLHRQSGDLADEAFVASEALLRDWRDCDELIAPVAGNLGQLVKKAHEIADSEAILRSIDQNMMLQAWISELRKIAAQAREEVLEAYASLASVRGEMVTRRFNDLKGNSDYRKIPTLFDERSSGADPEPADNTGRRTIWRVEALNRFGSPISFLAEQRERLGAEFGQLSDLWSKRALEPTEKAKIRRLFYDFISGEAGVTRGRRARVFPEGLKDVRSSKIIIRCPAIRKMFRKERANPTFLPQLADFGEIVLLSAPPLTARATGVAADWVKSVAAEKEATSLIVLLAPGLTSARRDEILLSFRQRGLSAAIIDDVDLCRLADDVTGHDFIPFMEVVLEQLDLIRTSPFSTQDGQHIRLEMYVGRQHQGELLAYRADYTRVFSGRKLGKSALLKYVAVTYDRTELPSGNKLNVLFITIAGGDSEDWVVAQIIAEMADRFKLTDPEQAAPITPADRFSNYVRTFLASRPTESLLIILDEADAFVEGQLSQYDSNPEGTLSFRMMKELPTKVDGNGLPRVRIVFSGYRVTNTREGVWANAGDVLRLKPLQEQEAIQFVSEALAKIGVDISDHAAFVARRCGFQPAVLIRFGDCLLKQLKRLHPAANRETLAVTQDDIVITYNDPAVMEEIRTIVNNNFQGNRAGLVIFSTMLLAIKDLPPGYMLEDGSSQVLAKLREIDSNTDWLERIDPDPYAEIQRHLQDFIERELVVSDEERFSARRTYRLRFPHFLPVLTQHADLTQQVRQHIQTLRQADWGRRHVGSILTDSAMEAVRYCFSMRSVDLCHAIVVAGHWHEAIQSEKAGVANRLGLSADEYVNCNIPGAFERMVSTGVRAFCNPSDGQCDDLVTIQRERPVFVTGGIEALRWFITTGVSRPEICVEIIGLLRLNQSRIAWWLEGVRALHFEATDAIERVFAITGGIPFLLSKLDALLTQEPGSGVSAEAFQDVLATFGDGWKDYATDLTDGSANVRLARRELDLLCMIGTIARNASVEFDIVEEFSEYWELCAPATTGFLEPPYALEGDPQALQLLELAGIIHVVQGADKKVIVVDPNGPLMRLVAEWGS